ncbi:hypothetical protein KQI84_08640 [bacterium]|nr:hypothetical protein [bacterium]
MKDIYDFTDAIKDTCDRIHYMETKKKEEIVKLAMLALDEFDDEPPSRLFDQPPYFEADLIGLVAQHARALRTIMSDQGIILLLARIDYGDLVWDDDDLPHEDCGNDEILEFLRHLLNSAAEFIRGNHASFIIDGIILEDDDDGICGTPDEDPEPTDPGPMRGELVDPDYSTDGIIDLGPDDWERIE